MDNSYEIEGRVKKILPIYVKGDFMKQEFCIVTEEQQPQIIKFEVHKKNLSQLSTIFPGDNVSLKFNIRGMQWIDPKGVTKIIQSFVVWKISKLENGYVVPSNDGSPHPQHNYKLPPAEEVFGKPEVYAFDKNGNKISEPFNEEDYDDLPF